MNRYPSFGTLALAATLWLPLSARLDAQTTPAGNAATGNPAATVEETITLSPFEVVSERDYGYTATSSLSGGRLATDLKDTAAPVSVLTREFLDDIGASNVQQALLYATNSIAPLETDVNPENGAGPQGTGSSDTSGGGNSLKVRGIRDATATLDYFKTAYAADTYNTERIDISRGPNALLFGDSSTGGTFNVSTKRALSRPITRLNLRTSSFGGGRVAVDVNRPLTRSVAVRVNLLNQQMRGFKDFTKDNRLGAALAGTWRINDSAEVRVQGEWGRIRQVMPANYIRESVANWNHTTTIKTLNQAVTAAQGLAANANNLVLNLAHPELGLYLLNGTRRTVQALGLNALPVSTGLPVPALGLTFPVTATAPIDAPAVLDGVKVFPVVPDYGWASRAAARRRDDDYYAVSVTIDKRWGRNLFTQLAAHTEEVERFDYPISTNVLYYDPNEILPAGVTFNGSNANPDFLKPYVQDSSRIAPHYPRNHELRAMAVYNLETKWFSQRIGLLASRRVSSNDGIVYRMVRIDNTAVPALNNANNLVVFRTNLDQRDLSSIDYELDRVYTLNGVQMAYRTFTGSGQATASSDGMTSYQLFSSGGWLPSRRLYTTLGVRRDYYHLDNFNTIVRDPVTTEVISLDPSDSVDNRVDSPSAGAVLHVLPQLSLYASRSKSFVPASGGALSYIGTPLPVRRGSGQDLGIKFALFGGRLTGSLGYYKTQELNNQVRPPEIVAAVTNISRTLAAFNEATLDFGTDVQTADAHGYELDLTANLTKNWALTLNAGLPKSTLTNALPYARLYLEASRDRWISEANQLVANGSDPTARTTIDNNIANYEGAFASYADGRPALNVRDYTVNLFTRYRFTDGRWRGLGIGGGVHFYGENYVQVVNNENIYSQPYHLVEALVSYERKLFGRNTRFQLNVTNLLDDENFQYVNYFSTTTAANGWPNNYRINVPREFRFSMEVNF